MGPLTGIRVIEIAGIGPGPFCAMMLADMGADVVRIDRASAARGGDPDRPPLDLLNRGRRSVGIDLKSSEGVETVLALVEGADALLEGFRPGVAERLGIGPADCLARNPRLVYGRMTGWGQEGPYASAAGHDLNYIALAGALHGIGRQGEAPVPPLNLVGDFGGGGMYLAFGMACALLEARNSGQGQVVDAAMVDGAASLMTAFFGMARSGFWSEERGTNMLDTGAHFYNVYETADGRYISLGPIEPQFYAELRERLGLHGPEWDHQTDRSRWPELKEKLAALVAQRTRDEWCELLEGTDTCFAPRAVAGRGARARPQPRARHLHPGGWSGPARSGPQIQPHPGCDPAPAASRGPAHRRDPRRTGSRCRGDRLPACVRSRRLIAGQPSTATEATAI